MKTSSPIRKSAVTDLFRYVGGSAEIEASYRKYRMELSQENCSHNVILVEVKQLQ